jgi:1-acyl-sn-glycerol-3-phosphate acyltransferase
MDTRSTNHVHGVNRPLYRSLKVIARLSFAPFFHTTVQGIEHLPKTSAFLLLPKHQRWEDIPLLGLICHQPLYYIAKKELFANGFMAWLMRSLGGIPLDRQRPLRSRASLMQAIQLLKAGEGIVLFPEGTYYPGTMGAGHQGMLRFIMRRLAIPWLPVGIRYHREGLRNQVTIRFGPPQRYDNGQPAATVLRQVMQAIAVLSNLESTS